MWKAVKPSSSDLFRSNFRDLDFWTSKLTTSTWPSWHARKNPLRPLSSDWLKSMVVEVKRLSRVSRSPASQTSRKLKSNDKDKLQKKLTMNRKQNGSYQYQRLDLQIPKYNQDSFCLPLLCKWLTSVNWWTGNTFSDFFNLLLFGHFVWRKCLTFLSQYRLGGFWS